MLGKTNRWYWGWAIGLTAGNLLFSPLPGWGQIVPDNTLGSEASTITPNVPVRGAPAELIQGGAQRGANLFHSFSQFQIGDLQRAYFANPAGVQNILGRVTGSAPSQILGTLGVDGPANLYLINPNGILFGPNARLDVSGAFTASTANRFQFPDGSEFSATNPQGVPLLSVNLKPGLQYGPNPGTLTSAATLTVGQELTLAAGNLNLSGQLRAGQNLTLQATDTVQIRDSATAPFIAAAGGKLTVQGDRSVDIFALNHPQSGLFSGADLVLRSANRVIGDARYRAGGSFRVEQLDGSLGGLISPNDPIVQATGDVNLAFYEGASLHIFAGGSVTIPGYVWIQGADPINGLVENVQLANGSVVPINGRTTPTLDIRAGTLALGTAPNNTGAPTDANIILGTILFAAPPFDIVTGSGNQPLAGQVLLTNQYQPNPNLTGSILLLNTLPGILENRAITNGSFLGGGRIDLHTKGDIGIRGIINADPVAFPFGGTSFILGNGGDVTLRAGGNIALFPITDPVTGVVVSGSAINSTGILGGKITLDGGGLVLLGQGGGLFSSSVGPAAGQKGGDVTITANSLLMDGASIVTSTVPLAFITNNAPQRLTAEADAGNISIRVADTVALTNNSQIQGSINFGGIGKASDIDIQARSLIVENSQITSLLFRELREPNGTLLVPGGQGQGGNIQIVASDSVVLSGFDQDGFAAGIGSPTERGASGPAGNITIATGLLQVTNGAVVATSTRNAGTGGNIIVLADAIELLSGGKILANSDSTGPGGAINLLANRVTISGRDPNFSDRIALLQQYLTTPLPPPFNATPAQLGDTIDDALLGVVVPNSGLYANTSGQGASGQVQVAAQQLEVLDQGLIVADTSGSATGGNILLQTQFLSVLSGGSILARTFGNGQGGNVVIAPLDASLPSAVTIAGVVPFTGLEVNPISGQLEPNGGFSSGIFTTTEDDPQAPPGTPSITGAAGNILLSTGILSLFDGGVLSARSRSAGAGGNMIVSASTIEMAGGGQMVASAFKTGNAGNMFVEVAGAINLTGFDASFGDRFDQIAQAFVDSGLTPEEALQRTLFTVDPSSPASGMQVDVVAGARQANAGLIAISAGSLNLSHQASLSSQTFGQGNSGVVLVNTREDITLTREAGIFSTVEEGAIGNALGVVLQARSLFMSGGANIQALTRGQGNAGGVFVTTTNSTVLSGLSPDGFPTGIFTSTEATAQGEGGAIVITSPSLSLLNGGILSARTLNAFTGGNILVDAAQVEAINGGRILTDALSSGNAGNIIVARNIVLGGPDGLSFSSSDRVVLQGNFGDIATGLFANTEVGSTAQGGNIFVAANQVQVLNGATISVDTQSFETEAIAGNIGIQANSIVLNNRGAISATTLSGNGGNIGLEVQDLLLLRRNSQVSTTAGLAPAGGDGGNIEIASRFIISAPLENSDIKANAYTGRGGRVEIDAGNIFWMITRSRDDLIRLLGTTDPAQLDPIRLQTNDITAISQVNATLNGVTEVTTTGADPSRGIVPLTIDLGDPSNLISQSCAPRDPARNSSFVSKGRGGLPQSPTDLPTADAVLADWGQSPLVQQPSPSPTAQPGQPTSSSANTTPDQIVEAQQWVKTPTGEIWLASQGDLSSSGNFALNSNCPPQK